MNTFIGLILILLILSLVPLTTACGQANRVDELESSLAKLESSLAEVQAEQDSQQSEAQELYNFAVQGLSLWDVMNEAIVGGMWLQFRRDHDEAYLETQELIRQLKSISNDLNLLYAPTSVLTVKEALLEEYDEGDTFLGYISGVHQFGFEGTNNPIQSFLNSALEMQEPLSNLNTQNYRDLINIKLQAEHDLR